MRHFSGPDREAIDAIAQRSGFSSDAVAAMLESVAAGHGRMAQFDHREFGGSGQWMRGGMTMVSDMFNSALKARVASLCDELAVLLAAQPAAAATSPGADRAGWWPPDLGQPNSAGSQNGARYAYFAAPCRLAIDDGGGVIVYDTLDHRISGVAQQQSQRGSLTFSSQHGVVEVARLPIVADERGTPPAPTPTPAPMPTPAPDNAIIATLEALAGLHRSGVLTEAEFTAKKAELLRRI